MSILDMFKRKSNPEITLDNIKNGIIKPEDIESCEDRDKFELAVKPLDDKRANDIKLMLEHGLFPLLYGHSYSDMLLDIGLNSDIANDFNRRMLNLNTMCPNNPKWRVR